MRAYISMKSKINQYRSDEIEGQELKIISSEKEKDF